MLAKISIAYNVKLYLKANILICIGWYGNYFRHLARSAKLKTNFKYFISQPKHMLDSSFKHSKHMLKPMDKKTLHFYAQFFLLSRLMLFIAALSEILPNILR